MKTQLKKDSVAKIIRCSLTQFDPNIFQLFLKQD